MKGDVKRNTSTPTARREVKTPVAASPVSVETML
jgi:hypothetical protein